MDKLVGAIYSRTTLEGKHLTIVRNPDGFLSRPDVQQRVLNESNLLLLPIKTSLELRVRFELYDKDSCSKVCYIVSNTFEMLPDLYQSIYSLPTFSLSDLLPSYDEVEIRQSDISFEAASYAYSRQYTYNLSAHETRSVLRDARAFTGEDMYKYGSKLSGTSLNWDNVETITSISELLVEIIMRNGYESVESIITNLNESFQEYLDSKYFALLTSSFINKPKTVNRILPHLSFNHSRFEKVALIVIDGMSYWQYMVLNKELISKGITPKCDFTLSWLPSITKLSRQAIFKGDVPAADYVQNPSNESALWKKFWTELGNPDKRFNEFDVEYIYGSLRANDTMKLRQAFVDVELDHKMHSSSSNKDLYDLTSNWARKAAEDIAVLHNQGFVIYITTDHGNIHAHKWRALTSHEKVFLYQNESRGSRHLTYQDHNALTSFLDSNMDIRAEQMVHDNWTIWRTSKCFKNQDEITHGGSHFLEVVIPFIKIEK